MTETPFRVPQSVALQEAHARERYLIDRTLLLGAAVEELKGQLKASQDRVAELEQVAGDEASDEEEGD